MELIIAEQLEMKKRKLNMQIYCFNLDQIFLAEEKEDV